MNIYKSFFVLLLVLIGYQSFSQQTIDNNSLIKEGIQISFKWKHSNFFNKKSPYQLNLVVNNTNNYDVRLSFKLYYYKSGIIQYESDTIQNCMKALQTIKGNKYGLNFSVAGFTNDEIYSKDFSFEIIPIENLKMRSCKQK